MDILCFSHLRWDFVYQRPQHLLSRFVKTGRVFYVEEPEFGAQEDGYTVTQSKEGVWVVIPRLTGDFDMDNTLDRQKNIVSMVVADEKLHDYILWYYTPMALQVSDHLSASAVVYDCMDELSMFKFAPPQLGALEQKLLEKADVVFTGGHSLYEAKKHQHTNIHPFPSSIDKAHFRQAREDKPEPADQSAIPSPRLGYYGVIDERFDIETIRQVAEQKPDWHFVLVGPVVKIDPAALPQMANIHYLGGKSYAELPEYLRGWDIALIPFALNEHTRFISPTKTPEYLAGGKPVISSAIQDVVNPYGVQNFVHIANDADTFIRAADKEMATPDKQFWLARVDAFLENNSWDATWQKMSGLVGQVLAQRNSTTERKEQANV